MIVVHCPKCWIEYGIPDALDKRLLEARANLSVYCPNGHTWYYTGEREADALRRERDVIKQQNARLHEEARQAIQARNVAQADLRRHKTRTKAGLCPCCNRSFVNMQRHMKTKHPDFNVVPLKTYP